MVLIDFLYSNNIIILGCFFINNIFYNYFSVNDLEFDINSELFVYSYLSSSIMIYPFQVASTNFVMNSYYNNLLEQWATLLESSYNLPFVVITNNSIWSSYINNGYDNPFIQYSIIITTQKILYDKQANTLFKEAIALL